jgi:hypothetical protein
MKLGGHIDKSGQSTRLARVSGEFTGSTAS